ncbi:ribonuclease R [Ruminococcaceae bacterium OttesenSCG-928-I18]|nr:ribonuclease R [Ruminococcaceae bacterium OttesenSCG-928-I18]
MSLKSSLLKKISAKDATAKELKSAVGADRKRVKRALEELLSEGKVTQKKGVYSLTGPRQEPVRGILTKLGHSFGFVRPLDGSGDIFIPGHSLQGAMPGDEVEVSLNRYPRFENSREGEVDAILTPQNKVVGIVKKEQGRPVLVPDNAKDTALLIQKSADGGVKEGEKAAGVIIQRGERHEDHVVGITMRFGSADSARQCAKAILYAAGVEKSFPQQVKAEAKQVAAEKITKEEIKKRKDLRGETIFTIDSASTKDIDDAISAKRVLDGYRLSVHIADVSHYVKPKSKLDEEALSRGTSIYYADSVIPMLPKPLSNGICSLNPGEDRLAFSCIMTLDSEARLLDYRFFKTVIQSRVKGVYSEVNAIFEGTAEEETQQKYAEVSKTLEVMEEIYQKLAKLRAVRGSMEIESEEPKLTIDEEGRCVGVEKRARGEAERMIEEFMLQANTAAAHYARRLEIPFLYRVHDKPSADRVEGLKALLKAAGLDFQFQGEQPTQKELSKILNDTRGTNLERPVHQGVLRSMAKADYQPLPKGHFGLALDDYAHFTSPIRRYPDLAIHRILGESVSGEAPAALRKKYKSFTETASVLASEREIRAQQVERDCDDSYKAEYMQQFIGQEFEGVVSSVVRFGIYVELASSVEGLIHISNLSDGSMELIDGVSLTDTHTGKSYRLGDLVQVRVAGVDISQGNVDFVLAQ